MRRRGPGCGCFGCGGSLLVLAVLIGAAWLFVLKPARDFLNGLQGFGAAQTQSGPATPSGAVNAKVSRGDVEAFVRTRRKVAQALGSNFTQAQAVWAQIQAGQTPNLVQVFDVIRNVGGSVSVAREAQVAHLRSEGMSLERYGVVRGAVNRALGLPSIDFSRVAQDVQQGRFPDLNLAVSTATPEERALVAPFQKELLKTAAAGLLGL